MKIIYDPEAEDTGACPGERLRDNRVVHQDARRRQGHGAPRSRGPRRTRPALAYNALVVSWGDVQTKAAVVAGAGEQTELFI